MTIASDENMQRECARYVNTLFAPQLANPSSAMAPWHGGMATRPDNTGKMAGDGSVAITGPRDSPSFDPDEVWPPVDDATDTDTTDDDADPADPADPAQKPAQRQSRGAVVDGVAIVDLYANLKQGQSVKQWYAQHSDRLAYIDIRRFITFGIIKGFLYRVHKYAYATGFPKHHKNHHHHHRHNSSSNSYFYNQYHPGMTSGLSSRGPGTGANSPYASSAGNSQGHHYYYDQGTSAQSESTNTTSNTVTAASGGTSTSVDDHDHGHDHDHDRDRDQDVVREEEEFIDNRGLVKYLDGMHCFDQICTELEVSERVLMARLRRYPGEVMVIHR